ncbi:hypothetical protein SAMN04488071_3296 [Kordiimonas lacus]|uniref:Peptidase family M48 n=1 Tax=Kordiimonas lacus TaxID=637679 RepID=A0A1G7E5M4_9PROT|nr:hypothetical protein SAMN04488071_3296 [Kordiimonas lacus]
MRTLFISLFMMVLCGQPDAFAQAMFVGYDDFCGVPVSVGNTGRGAIADRDAAGNPFIVIDPDMFSNWTNSRLFVLAHECAHHRLGHTTNLGKMNRSSPWGTRSQELAADCWAAKALLDRKAYFDVDRVVRNHVSKGHYSSDGYPSGFERAQNISMCVFEADLNVRDSFYSGCSMQNSSCNHALHARGDVMHCRHMRQAHLNGDVIPCQHACRNIYGGAQACHPRGDIVPCQHAAPVHPSGDLVPCQHAAHPGGHRDLVCR